MRQIATGFLVLAAISTGVWAQTFEVASIKVVPEERRRGDRGIDTKPGSLTVRNMPLGPIIGWAYKTSAGLVINPEIVNANGNETYDIAAKAAEPAKSDELRAML